MMAAGIMKQHPATISPRQPRLKKPIWMAISVELGPGIKLAAPSLSKKLLVREPVPATHKLLFHHGDVRGRPAKSNGAQLQEDERQLGKPDFLSVTLCRRHLWRSELPALG